MDRCDSAGGSAAHPDLPPVGSEGDAGGRSSEPALPVMTTRSQYVAGAQVILMIEGQEYAAAVLGSRNIANFLGHQITYCDDDVAARGVCCMNGLSESFSSDAP